tara:strand:+ start:1876 stop:2331 length:456 start_codon:yes stop_codon:yes gene_type:complete
MPDTVVIKDVSGNKVGIDGDRLKVDAVLEVGDIEIGAVEIKNHDTDDRVEVNSNNALKTIQEVPQQLNANQLTVTTAGSRVNFVSLASLSITIKALAGNTGLIYVGGNTVDSSNGFELSAGDSISLAIDNHDEIWIDSSVSGEGISYMSVR